MTLWFLSVSTHLKYVSKEMKLGNKEANASIQLQSIAIWVFVALHN